jgi:hypothetical protein
MPPGKKEHRTTHDDEKNTRRSYDIEDSGIRGIGSNWVTVSNPHFTNQNESKGSPDRHTGDVSLSEDIYGE